MTEEPGLRFHMPAEIEFAAIEGGRSWLIVEPRAPDHAAFHCIGMQGEGGTAFLLGRIAESAS